MAKMVKSRGAVVERGTVTELRGAVVQSRGTDGAGRTTLEVVLRETDTRPRGTGAPSGLARAGGGRTARGVAEAGAG